jgi:tripartite motif-containing protein 71
MGKFTLIAAAASGALAAVCALGAWVYEGEFHLDCVMDVATAPNDNVYAVEWDDEHPWAYIFWFTSTGSYLGNTMIQELEPGTLDVASNRNVYVGYSDGVAYYTASGGLLGTWSCYPQGSSYVKGIALNANDNVYAAEWVHDKINYFTATGSKLGDWGRRGSGDGEFMNPMGVAVAPNGNVYVADQGNSRVQYFTSTGSFLGKWGKPGKGEGEFYGAWGIAVHPNGDVYVVDNGNFRVQYFTATGSFLGQFGKYGAGNGEFDYPYGIDLSNDGRRLYVADEGNWRIQYFRDTTAYVSPASLGRVKALFR